MPNSALGGAKSGARLQTSEQAQEHAIALLRCAAATAQETATHQHGSQRELTFALMHMMDMARALLEHKQHEDRGL
ncbi:hypothetical protein PWA60_16775 [Pseudomonas juntendi]|uniref:DUF3077 domain-containing protein n=1 Tax=Pseudomonas juntendi TaxID=2666183 RepID=A0AAJ5S514_9PSED|nr:hypothetical protein [Pseudomonas juntendi]WEA23183.1 hypothetical protein PWA60_16775 [Pseudomonas juntendi]